MHEPNITTHPPNTLLVVGEMHFRPALTKGKRGNKGEKGRGCIRHNS